MTIAVVAPRASGITPAEILDFYFTNNFRLVFWPHVGDNKGPRETGWTERAGTT